MFKKALLLLAVMFAGSSAQALTCNSYPYTLVNGVVADANQVMANFNLVRDCVDSNVLPLIGGTLTGPLILTGGAPAITAGQGAIWGSATNGALIQGSGSADDIALVNKNGVVVAHATTGSTAMDFPASPTFPTPSTSDSSTKGTTTAYTQAQFSTGRTLADPGSATFGSGGLIKKFGTSTTPGTGAGTTITFGTAFPNAIIEVQLTRSSGGSIATQCVAMSSSNRLVGSFIAQALNCATDTPATTGFNWEATGY